MIIDKIAEKVIRKLFPRVIASIENAAITNLSECADSRLAKAYSELAAVQSTFAEINGQYVVRNRINGAYTTYADSPLDRVNIGKSIAEKAIELGVLIRVDCEADRIDAFYVDMP